jgi:hypothetical protein
MLQQPLRQLLGSVGQGLLNGPAVHQVQACAGREGGGWGIWRRPTFALCTPPLDDHPLGQAAPPPPRLRPP